jgi:hypothetical protein
VKQSVVTGIILGVAVAVWTLIMGVTGWYKHPVGAIAFMLVIPINVAVIVWGLTRTRREGRNYGGQVTAGLVMGIVAAVLVFGNSLLFTQVLFPTYFDDLRTMQEEMLRASGIPEDQIAERIETAQASQTPVAQATLGALGTIATSLVTAVVAAIWIRRKN